MIADEMDQKPINSSQTPSERFLAIAGFSVLGSFWLYLTLLMKHAHISSLTLNQLLKAAGGVFTASVILFLCMLWLSIYILNSRDAEWIKVSLGAFFFLFGVFIYVSASYAAYNFALNSGATNVDAQINGLFSIVKLGEDFTHFMSTSRDVPIGQAVKQFSRLASPPPPPLQP